MSESEYSKYHRLKQGGGSAEEYREHDTRNQTKRPMSNWNTLKKITQDAISAGRVVWLEASGKPDMPLVDCYSQSADGADRKFHAAFMAIEITEAIHTPRHIPEYSEIKDVRFLKRMAVMLRKRPEELEGSIADFVYTIETDYQHQFDLEEDNWDYSPEDIYNQDQDEEQQ